MDPEITPNMQLAYMKGLILHTSEPLIIKNKLAWELLKWDVNKWTTVLGNERLPFRRGKNCYTPLPQRENTTETVYMTFKEFLDYQTIHPQNWLYFDYKYLRNWFVTTPELQEHISWEQFGFPELNYKDSTIWIGTKGAHTPCHTDTYGCNIIAQIYGRKRWILFPPDENLQPTRIPFEESSIFSKLNLFTPSIDAFSGINDCRSVVLNPGDVLILPHKWWHYVENLDLAISINTWINLPVDYEERFNESIVRLLISHITKPLDPEQQQLLLNPSRIEDGEAPVTEDSTESLIAMVLTTLKHYKIEKRLMDSSLNKTHMQYFMKCLTNIEVVERLSEDGFKILLEIQKNKFDYDDSQVIDFENVDEIRLKKVVDAILHCDVVNLIKQKLLEDD